MTNGHRWTTIFGSTSLEGRGQKEGARQMESDERKLTDVE